MSGEAQPFRLRNKDDPKGAISIPKMLRASIRYGEFHFMWLVPHFIIPIYGGYRLLSQWGLWPSQFASLGELLLALVQGASIGGCFVFGFLRWSQPGRALKGRRDAGVASPGEERAIKKIQLGFAVSAYILFASIVWLALPPADGPRTAALKQTARRYGFTPK
ncbi:unnamed protein product [Sympodiomycopsis kandeliae]